MNDSPTLVVNPDLEVRPLDSDSEEPMSVCEVPAGDGRRRRYAVPRSVVELIELFKEQKGLAEGVKEYRRRHPDRYSREKLEGLVRGFLVPKGLLLQEGELTISEREPSQSFLYIKLPLISRHVVEPVARFLKWAYKTPVVIAWIPLFVGLHVYFYSQVLPQHELDFNSLNIGGILLLMLLSTVGTFVHELGHASAAAHYGCRRLEIGWGLYLVFTVLYTDVSEAWRLPRRQRAMVDLGGIYFQSVFLGALLVLFFATRSEIYLFALIFSDLAIASSLNPFLRLDGYWLMSDLFGILNLRQKSMELLRSWASRILPWMARKPSSGVRLSRKARVALVVYSVAGIAFFLFLVKIIFNRVAMRLVVGYPEVLAGFVVSWQAGSSGVEVVGGVVEILWRSMMLVGFGFIMFNVLKWIVGTLRKAIAKRSGAAPRQVAETSGAA